MADSEVVELRAAQPAQRGRQSAAYSLSGQAKLQTGLCWLRVEYSCKWMGCDCLIPLQLERAKLREAP